MLRLKINSLICLICHMKQTVQVLYTEIFEISSLIIIISGQPSTLLDSTFSLCCSAIK